MAINLKKQSDNNRETIAECVPCEEIANNYDYLLEKKSRKRNDKRNINELFLSLADDVITLSNETYCEYGTILNVLRDNKDELCNILLLREKMRLISQEIKEKTLNLNLAY